MKIMDDSDESHGSKALNVRFGKGVGNLSRGFRI